MKYTRESPFEFKGVKYYLHAYGEALVVNECSRESITDLRATDASAIHALVKAEKSPWQPVAFADVKVDDEIKSVSDCGTMRRGVVSGRHVTFAEDADRNYIAKDTWTLYRRTPPSPAVPNVGDYIRAVPVGGVVDIFEVIQVLNMPTCFAIRGGRESYFISKPDAPANNKTRWDLRSWSPAKRPAPEPKTFAQMDTDERLAWLEEARVYIAGTKDGAR